MTSRSPSGIRLLPHKPKKGGKHARGGNVTPNIPIETSSTPFTRPSVTNTSPPIPPTTLPVKEPFYVRNRGVIGSLLIANVAVCTYVIGRFGGFRPLSTKPPPPETEEHLAEKNAKADPTPRPEVVSPTTAERNEESLPRPPPTVNAKPVVLETSTPTIHNKVQHEEHAESFSVGEVVKLTQVTEIPEYERRAVLLWMLWQKRRAVPSSAEEKAQIDDDKRVLKEFLRSKQALRELAPMREARQVPSPIAEVRAVMKWILGDKRPETPVCGPDQLQAFHNEPQLSKDYAGGGVTLAIQ